MRNKKGKKKQLGYRVAVEIQSRRVALVVAEQDCERLTKIRGHEMAWAHEATSLSSETAVRELTDALTTLVAEEKVAGAGVHLSLSSELCVTRVAAGEADSLRPEVRELQDRSSQYLSLGAGEKTLAESSRAIDAKHSQTWLTVANKQVLDNIVTAVEAAGLHVDFVEHALLSMCRVIGTMQYDADRPVILIDVNERGVDLGVSYRGQLLFDYRPGGVASKDHIAEIVGRHRERIQRYCNRQFRFVSGDITDVFICGESTEMESVRQQFAATALKATVLDPTTIHTDWDYADGFQPNARFVAALGSLLVGPDQLQQPPGERGLPDLMDSYRSSWKEPLLPALMTACWPIAATLLVAVGIYSAAMYESGRAARLETQQLAFENQLQQVATKKLETEAAQKKIRYLKQINAAVSHRAYHRLIAAIAQSLPSGCWLETIRVDRDGVIAIQGPGESEDQIFNFVEELKKVPMLTDISLEGQQPVRLKRGPAIRFDIKCRYGESDDSIERTARND